MSLTTKTMATSKTPIHTVTEAQFKQYFIPLLPKNKRGFASHVSPYFLFRCIQHKLKTGCQWEHLFLDTPEVSYPCSAQLVYYFFNRWSKFGVFEQAYQNILKDKQTDLDTTELNLDGTHSAAKKGALPWRIKREKKRGPAICSC